MDQQSKDMRLKQELESTYFVVSEIQADYEEFVKRLFPESVRGVLFLFAFLLENFQREQAPWRPADLLFFTQKISKTYEDLPAADDSVVQDEEEDPEVNAKAQRRRRPDKGGGLPLYIDPVDFQLIEAIATVVFRESRADRDFKNLFSIFQQQACGGLQLVDRNDRRVPFTFVQ